MSLFVTIIVWVTLVETNFVRVQSYRPDFDTGNNCTLKRRLEVLPGRGWDNLRNKDMGQVLRLGYSSCKTTEDGLYLIPDDVYVSARKESDLQMRAEFIGHWSEYTDITAQSFKANAGASFFFGLLSIEGSFSKSYQEAKKRQVGEKSETARISLKSTVYNVQSSSAGQLSFDLLLLFLDAIAAVGSNNIQKADVILELIIRDYGTHFVTQAEGGAILFQEDFISSKYVSEHSDKKNQMLLAASVNFQFRIGLNAGMSTANSDDHEVLESYNKSVTSTHVRAIGGQTVSPNFKLSEWVATLPDNLVMIDRFGNPLSYLLTPLRFPDVSLEVLQTTRERLDMAIKRYYSYNTYKGCTDATSKNFDFMANADDGSCNDVRNEFNFGGVYQTCRSQSTANGDLCQPLTQGNSLKACPRYYETVHLLSTIIESVKCSRECSGWWIFKSCKDHCTDEDTKSQAILDTYWCVGNGSEPPNTGLMFGGLYTTQNSNSVTKSRSCPPSFTATQIGSSMWICTSNNYELSPKYAVPFGGFFSCSEGNPFYNKNSKPYMKSCPVGYAQHMAVIDHECEINYCTLSTDGSGIDGEAVVKRPPFTDLSHMYDPTMDYGTLQDIAKNMMDPNYAPGRPENYLGDVSKEDTSSMNGGMAAMIVISLLLFILLVVGGILAWRKYKQLKEVMSYGRQDSERA